MSRSYFYRTAVRSPGSNGLSGVWFQSMMIWLLIYLTIHSSCFADQKRRFDEGDSMPKSTVKKSYRTVLAMNPVGYWPADDGEGDQLKDLTLNQNHARLHNVEWDGSLLKYRGLYQWAEIPGSDKYVSNKFSIGGWVFLRDRVKGGWNDNAKDGPGMTFIGNGYHTSSFSLETLNSEELLFSKSKWGVMGGSAEGASILIRRGQRLDILSGGQNNAMETSNEEAVIDIGKWHHIMYTFERSAPIEGGKMWLELQDTKYFDKMGKGKLYLDGQLIKSSERVPFAPINKDILIGSDAIWWLQAVTSGSLDGSVRDLVIFDRAIQDNEVAILFGKTQPQVAPQVYGKNTVFLNENPVDVNELHELSPDESWIVLRQLGEFEKEDLEPFIPWVKTQIGEYAVKLLLKFGDDSYVEAQIPKYISTYKNEALSVDRRVDALLSIAACKKLAKELAFPDIYEDFKKLTPRHLKIEDYLRNALCYAVSELGLDKRSLKTIVPKYEGRYFSQGDEMRDHRGGKGLDYTSSANFSGNAYRVGTGIAWHNVEDVSNQEFEEIAKEVEVDYPNVRQWAEGKILKRVYVTKTRVDGSVERVYPLGRKFIFHGRDAKVKAWALAVDKDGYVHLAGGMHNAPDENNFMPGTWESWGMSRNIKDDRYPTMPYWVSKRPEDITEFEFVGHRDNPRNIPVALGLNYINFTQNRNAELHVYGRIFVQGIQSWGFYKYNSEARSWSALGGYAPDVKKEFPVWADKFITMAADWLALPSIRWKHNDPRSTVLGWSRQPHFYNFIRGWGVRWDPNNRMHVNVPMFALDRNLRFTNTDLYAYSDDGGQTFQSADGSSLTLPLTANPGEGNAGLDTAQRINRYNLWARVLYLTGCRPGFKLK